jgi:hypothetical protein
MLTAIAALAARPKRGAPKSLIEPDILTCID